MFESQKFNSSGIYYVKINQNNTWKYVIVDDYIPVCVGADGKTEECAFLKLINSSPTQVQIWPLILQKAYSKFYSTYESLDKGNEVDFLQQLTGCPIEEVSVCPENMQKIQEQLQNFDSILFAKNKNQRVYPLVPKRENIIIENPHKFYMQQKITHQEFIDSF